MVTQPQRTELVNGPRACQCVCNPWCPLLPLTVGATRPRCMQNGGTTERGEERKQAV